MSRKRDKQPLTTYIDNGKLVVGITQWRKHKGQLLRHHKYYYPTPSSISRVEKLSKNMKEFKSGFYPGMILYYRKDMLDEGAQ